jgi:hypothetical protein
MFFISQYNDGARCKVGMRHGGPAGPPALITR